MPARENRREFGGGAPRAGAEAGLPDISGYLMQVASNSCGDTFLLRNDGSIGQFDHETCSMLKLAVELPALVDSFFQDPKNLDDLLEQGWVELEDVVDDVEAYKQEERVTKIFSELSYWAGLAVVIKLHARVGKRIAGVLSEPSRSTFLDQHRRILKLTTTAACSGRFCPEEDIGIDEDDFVECVERGMEIGASTHSLHASVLILMYAAIRDDWTEDYASSFTRSVLNLLDGNFPAFDDDELQDTWRFVERDIAHVKSLNLGESGSLDRPVPSTFFESLQ